MDYEPTGEDRDKAIKEIKELVRGKNLRCDMGSLFCKEFQKNHKQECTGCESEKGCKTVKKLFDITLKGFNTVKSKTSLLDVGREIQKTKEEIQTVLEEAAKANSDTIPGVRL